MGLCRPLSSTSPEWRKQIQTQKRVRARKKLNDASRSQSRSRVSSLMAGQLPAACSALTKTFVAACRVLAALIRNVVLFLPIFEDVCFFI